MTTADYLTQLGQDRDNLVTNLQTKGITGLTGDETFTELVPEVLNIPSGSGGDNVTDWSVLGYSATPTPIQNYYDTALNIMNTIPQGEDLYDTVFERRLDIVILPYFDTSNCTDFSYMCQGCENLISVPSLNTSKGEYLRLMFDGCTKLEEVPVFDFASATELTDIFYNDTKLSNASLNNILTSLLSASSYNGTKTLKEIGLSQAQATTCTGLSVWADCQNAGWTTGY